MTTTEKPRTAHEMLDDELAEIGRLLPVLVSMLGEPDTGGPRLGTIGRHAPDGSEPWNSAVADALWGPWFGLGHVVNELRLRHGMARLVQPPRGLDAIPVISNLAAGLPDDLIALACRRVARWARRAGELPAVDETEPWASLPTVTALGHPPACPYCQTFALRMRKRAGEVRCFFPDCADADGRPTRARMERGRMTGDAMLVFGDGMTLAF